MRLVILSDKFYQKYGPCKEVLQKHTRPYMCLAVRVNEETFAIPFRHHIRHKYAFFTGPESGLDYTKAVVIIDETYIDHSHRPQIEQSEFNAIKGMEPRIENGLRRYIDLYKKAVQYRTSRHYSAILSCSALQYFEEYL